MIRLSAQLLLASAIPHVNSVFFWTLPSFLTATLSSKIPSNSEPRPPQKPRTLRTAELHKRSHKALATGPHMLAAGGKLPVRVVLQHEVMVNTSSALECWAYACRLLGIEDVEVQVRGRQTKDLICDRLRNPQGGFLDVRLRSSPASQAQREPAEEQPKHPKRQTFKKARGHLS